jgi:hypothetical protein
MAISQQEAIQAQAAFENTLLERPNVVGVAVGRKNLTGDLSVVTLVQQKLPLAALSAADVIPKQIDGVQTDVIEVGYLRAYESPRDRFRPIIPGGVSIGHFKITAGTLGVLVTDITTGAKLILSNNHVLANSNDAQIGDPILQPGPTDGGLNPNDIVARLERFVRLRYIGDPPEPTPGPTPGPGPGPTPGPGPGPNPPPASCDVVTSVVQVVNALAALVGSQQRVAPVTVAPPPAPLSASSTTPAAQTTDSNEVDAALARPVDPTFFSDDIRGIGRVQGTKPATLGMRVRKSGRTTGYTEGTVNLLNATVTVAYGSKQARFTGQVITGPISQGGDSGSLIVDGVENKAVGLLFAGSNLSTIFTPIDVVLNALQVRL